MFCIIVVVIYLFIYLFVYFLFIYLIYLFIYLYFFVVFIFCYHAAYYITQLFVIIIEIQVFDDNLFPFMTGFHSSRLLLLITCQSL